MNVSQRGADKACPLQNAIALLGELTKCLRCAGELRMRRELRESNSTHKLHFCVSPTRRVTKCEVQSVSGAALRLLSPQLSCYKTEHLPDPKWASYGTS